MAQTDFPMSNSKLLGCDASPAAKELHQLWENDEKIREGFRHHGSLLKWGEKMVALPCMANVSKNSHVLVTFCDYFCPQQTGPKAPRIGFIRAQVRGVQHKVLDGTESIIFLN